MHVPTVQRRTQSRCRLAAIVVLMIAAAPACSGSDEAEPTTTDVTAPSIAVDDTTDTTTPITTTEVDDMSEPSTDWSFVDLDGTRAVLTGPDALRDWSLTAGVPLEWREPSTEDLAEVEGALAGGLTDAGVADAAGRLPGYSRWYGGGTDSDGARLVTAVLWERPYDDDALSGIPLVSDGGDSYIEIVYDLETSTFRSVRPNGES